MQLSVSRTLHAFLVFASLAVILYAFPVSAAKVIKVESDIGTSTAEQIAADALQPEAGSYPATGIVQDSKGVSWYMVDFYIQREGDKRFYYRGRELVHTTKGTIATKEGPFAYVIEEMDANLPVKVVDEATREIGYNYSQEDASGAASDALALTPDYSVATSSLQEGPTQYYYVIDFIRYDSYAKKFYWGKRAVVDPFSNSLIYDPAVLSMLHARAIDVPPGYDPLTKEQVTAKRTFAGDAKGIISDKISLAIAATLVLLTFGLFVAVRRGMIRISQLRLIDTLFGAATLAQLGFAFYLARYTDDQSNTYVWVLIFAISTATAWISTRGQLRPAQSDDLTITKSSELPKFADVGGMESVKEEIRGTVGVAIRYGAKASAMGVNFNGILLYGPPGVGKTFMARATAGEFGLNFIGVKVSDMTSMYQAASTQMVASIFKRATKAAPCLLFFDEFDSVAQQRGQGVVTTEDTRIVNQLLRSLEEIRSLQGKVIVMAATNDKNKLDEAVIRPGRFDRHIMIPMPDIAARTQIISQVLKNKPVGKDIDVAGLAKLSEGMSAADIATAIDKAMFAELHGAMKSPNGSENISVSNEELVSAFRNLYAREKQTVKKTTWNDLILPDETMKTLKRLVKLIEDPDATEKIGIEPPRGILLYGPPGTGKTTIARVIANEANASFVSINASDVYSKWLGESEQNIKKLFDEARRHKPSIIFMDEIDAIMRQRGMGDTGGWADKVTNQILQEIDGIKDSSGLFIIGATNAMQSLDPALLRGGRLSEKIEIPLPGLEERKKLFDLYLQKAKVDPAIDKTMIAANAVGLSGADIKAIAQQAILDAYDRGGAEMLVTQGDLTNAIDKTTIGPERKLHAMDENERKNTAYHEAGHALVGSVLPNAAPVQRITIVSRGHALGYTMHFGNTEKSSRTRQEFLDEIAVSLGGYVAEKIIFGDITTGASNDLQKANQIARSMVTEYGMSEKLGAMVSAQVTEVDQEVRAIIEGANKKTEDIITRYRPALDAIANKLLEIETLDRVDYEKIIAQFGIVPGKPGTLA